MNDKNLELLQSIAEKFGTTVEHLWNVLLKQAMLSAWIDGIIGVVTLGLWISAFFFVRKKTKSKWSKDEASMGWFVLGLAGCFAFVLVGFCASAVVTALINPEYLALKKFLELR